MAISNNKEAQIIRAGGIDQYTTKVKTAADRRNTTRTTSPHYDQSLLKQYQNKHGAELGKTLYKQYNEKRFRRVTESSNWSKQLILQILQNVGCDVDINDVYYGDKNNGKSEFFISFGQSRRFNYDLTFRSIKFIIEFDEYYWHPTEQQSILDPNTIHAVTKKTNLEMYQRDRIKDKLAESKGFTIIHLRQNEISDSDIEHISRQIIDKYKSHVLSN